MEVYIVSMKRSNDSLSKTKIKVKRKTPEKEVDALFPGREELRKLSLGMFEEIEPDEVEYEQVQESRPQKPQRIAGNRHHDADGRFSEPDKASSESIGFWETPKDGTIQGKWRRSGRGREKRWRTLGCGREDKAGERKAKHRCKDKPLKETLRVALLEALDGIVRSLAEEQKLNEVDCPPGCSTFEQIIKSIDLAVRASKGEALKPPK